MNLQTLMILLNSVRPTTAQKPNVPMVYCAIGVFIYMASWLICCEIRDAQANSYVKNFHKLRLEIALKSLQQLANSKHITHKLDSVIDSKYIISDKTKLDFLQDIVNTLSIDETMELKQSISEMELPMMCRGHIMRILNAHRRKCIREQKQH